MLQKLEDSIKGFKIRQKYLPYTRKVKGLGPAANSKDSEFSYQGSMITVSEYFEKVGASDPVLRSYLHNGKLKHPELPTINVGRTANKTLIPIELCVIPGGQCKARNISADDTAAIVKYAAVLPERRMQFLTDPLFKSDTGTSKNIINTVCDDAVSAAFGLSDVSTVPKAVMAHLLPPAKLLYGNSVTVEPGLKGQWNMEVGKHKFYQIPEGSSRERKVLFAVFVVAETRPASDTLPKVNAFLQGIIDEGSKCNLFLQSLIQPTAIKVDSLKPALLDMKTKGCRIAIIVMNEEGKYGEYKLISDSLGFLTQNVKLKTVIKSPRGISSQIALKLNAKLGGMNHILASRATNIKKAPGSWQQVPASISWLFDSPCMLVGIDVSHPDKSSDAESIAAVVGSLDCYASQYACIVTSQKSRKEMVTSLEDMFVKLLQAFKDRNGGKLPVTIVVYRDGVSEGQYDQVVNIELAAIKGSIELMGNPADSIKVCIVISQKGHNTRLFFEEVNGSLINVCPGMCIDNRGGTDSIVSTTLPEFYLNSHHAALGTAKPCKYTIVYDEIGLKNSELQLLTYWSTYLYSRCNRSVSLATPAYYAHWASKRGAQLVAAGATGAKLEEISNLFKDSKTPMFFI